MLLVQKIYIFQPSGSFRAIVSKWPPTSHSVVKSQAKHTFTIHPAATAVAKVPVCTTKGLAGTGHSPETSLTTQSFQFLKGVSFQ